MLAELLPRAHVRYASLPMLGPFLNGFTAWLGSHGYPPQPIRWRVRAAKRLEVLLRQKGVGRIEDLTAAQLLACAPKDARQDVYLSALIRSLAGYLDAQGVLAPPRVTPRGHMVAAYRAYLQRVRGLTACTVVHHADTAKEFLASVGYGDDPTGLDNIGPHEIDEFLKKVGSRRGRASLQHTVAHLRSFLRFLAARRLIAAGLDTRIDTPRVYRGERLPRALPWETVRSFLRAIDRSTVRGRRDYAMFLLIVTYGLRTCEVVASRLEHIDWRSGLIRIPRTKVGGPLVLPLTEEVGTALVDYVQHGRPALSYREVFLRVRAPAGALKPTAVTEAFQTWTRRSGLPIPFQGPHCLRHSLAVRLLRQGAPLKTIGDLLGHRSAESTCVYLRLQVEDLRDVALDLPVNSGGGVQR
jgi:integrase/recombinase XerD